MTPPTQAFYHFHAQKLAPRYLIQIPFGGHNQIGETLQDCREDLWVSMAREGKDLEKVLGHCKAQPKLFKK